MGCALLFFLKVETTLACFQAYGDSRCIDECYTDSELVIFSSVGEYYLNLRLYVTNEMLNSDIHPGLNNSGLDVWIEIIKYS